MIAVLVDGRHIGSWDLFYQGEGPVPVGVEPVIGAYPEHSSLVLVQSEDAIFLQVRRLCRRSYFSVAEAVESAVRSDPEAAVVAGVKRVHSVVGQAMFGCVGAKFAVS